MPEIKIIRQSITRVELKKIAEERYGDLVKGAVDIEQEILALGGELHIDISVFLYEQCQSKTDNTWGINLYPNKSGDDMIEFDSVINLKPVLGNRTRGIDDIAVQEKIRHIVNKLII